MLHYWLLMIILSIISILIGLIFNIWNLIIRLSLCLIRIILRNCFIWNLMMLKMFNKLGYYWNHKLKEYKVIIWRFLLMLGLKVNLLWENIRFLVLESGEIPKLSYLVSRNFKDKQEWHYLLLGTLKQYIHSKPSSWKIQPIQCMWDK